MGTNSKTQRELLGASGRDKKKISARLKGKKRIPGTTEEERKESGAGKGQGVGKKTDVSATLLLQKKIAGDDFAQGRSSRDDVRRRGGESGIPWNSWKTGMGRAYQDQKKSTVSNSDYLKGDIATQVEVRS